MSTTTNASADWPTMTVFFTLFDTAIGRCAIAWGARGIAYLQLPEANEPKTRARAPAISTRERGGPTIRARARAGQYRRVFARRAG
jgi:hypothetical protein